MNPNVPVSPPEIATEMKALLAAGASIIHSHIEDKTTGQVAADRYMEGWAPVFKAFPDAVLCSTSTRAPTFEEKWLHMELLAEQGMSMGVIDPGSVNLADSGAHGLPGPRAMVHANSFAEIDYGMKLLARHQLGPSIAIFEPGFLRTTLAYERAGTLPPGALCKLYFGGDYNWLAFVGPRYGIGGRESDVCPHRR